MSATRHPWEEVKGESAAMIEAAVVQLATHFAARSRDAKFFGRAVVEVQWENGKIKQAVFREECSLKNLTGT